MYGIVPGCQSLNAGRQAKKEARITQVEAMPSFWRSVYYSVKQECHQKNRLKMLHNLVENRKDIPPIPADSIAILVEAFPNIEQEAMEVLGKHLSTND